MKLKNGIQKIKAFFPLKNKRAGFYSPNKGILFFLLSAFLFMLLLGKSLDGLTLKIKSPYISKLYQAFISPISDISQRTKLDTLIPASRAVFLRIAKLEGLSDWDSFYNMDINSDIQAPSSAVSKKEASIKDISDELEKTRESLAASMAVNKDTEALKDAVDKLEKKLENLNTLLDRLKELEQERTAELEKLNAEKEALSLKQKELEQAKVLVQPESDSEKEEKVIKKIYTYNHEKPLRILMVGDSQMHSIAAGFLRLTGQSSSIRVKEISVHSSGFIRSDYYNWPKKLKNVFEESKNEPYDIAVIFLGMNDYQNFYADNGKVLVKETEDWESAYRDKIKTHLNVLLANTKKVYWLGMPIVRDKIYNAQLLYIEDLHKKIASEYSSLILNKFSLSSVAPGEGVPYTDSLKTAEGKKIRLMKDDGHHYTVSGGEYVMQPFLELLYKDWDLEPCTP